jgi:hypothetical protein
MVDIEATILSPEGANKEVPAPPVKTVFMPHFACAYG